MKVGFSGTRAKLHPRRFVELENLLEKIAVSELHHGDCVGCDAMAHEIAEAMGCKVVIHPPVKDDLRAFKKSPLTRESKYYLDRNRDIVDETEVLVAMPQFPDRETKRSGTWYTIRYARSKGKKVIIV